jgi:hypothetical protein
MHMHGHEVPSARRAGSRAMHVRDTHRLTGRSITRSVVALGPDGARKDADVAAKQRQAASASREHPPSGVAFSAASDAAVRSLHRGRTARTRPQKPYAEWPGAHCCCRCSAHGTRRRARQPLECARPCGERERIVAWWVARRFHAHMRAVARRGRVGERGRHATSLAASPLRQFGLSRIVVA